VGISLVFVDIRGVNIDWRGRGRKGMKVFQGRGIRTTRTEEARGA